MKTKLLFTTFLLLAFGLNGICQDPVILTVSQPLPLVADAGPDHQVSKGESVTLGGIPSALQGYGDYIYLWSPAKGLDDPTLPNPKASPDETTTYLLTVSDAQNCSVSDEVTLTVEASGIEDIPATLKILCYPNPVADELVVRFMGAHTGFTIRLINPLGQEMMVLESHSAGPDSTEKIIMKDMPAGIYFIQVVSGQTSIIQSVIKSR